MRFAHVRTCDCMFDLYTWVDLQKDPFSAMGVDEVLECT